MCGRYEFSSSTDDEKTSRILERMEQLYPGQYKTGEIYPGDAAPALIAVNGRITAVPATFGFRGFGGKLLINARSETAASKPSFATFLRETRILLPASGFYEWGRDPGKTKYYFQTDGKPVMYLCGIGKQEDGCIRFVILTREANESMAETHDRMPVIISEKEVRDYLTDQVQAERILREASPKLLREKA